MIVLLLILVIQQKLNSGGDNIMNMQAMLKQAQNMQKEMMKIKKSSCCLYCAREITNANIIRHLDSCCPKQDNKLLVFKKFNDQNENSQNQVIRNGR